MRVRERESEREEKRESESRSVGLSVCRAFSVRELARSQATDCGRDLKRTADVVGWK